MGAISHETQKATTLLQAWGSGNHAALGELLLLVQEELRRLARRSMSHERPGQAPPATALIDAAYMRLIEIKHVAWQNRAHFLSGWRV